MEKTQLGQGLFVATRVLGICYDGEAAGLRLEVTGRRIERRAQLDQGQYGPRLWGNCEDAKRPGCDANGRRARGEAAA